MALDHAEEEGHGRHSFFRTGEVWSTVSKSKSSHVRLLTTASPEKRRPLGRSQRLEGSLPTRRADKEILPHKSGEVDHRSSKNRARENTTNLRAGSIIEMFSTKFGAGWYKFLMKKELEKCKQGSLNRI